MTGRTGRLPANSRGSTGLDTSGGRGSELSERASEREREREIEIERERERESGCKPWQRRRVMARSDGGDEEQQRGVAAAATRSGGGELLRRICGEGPSRDKSFWPRKPGRGTADLIGCLPLVTINRLVWTGRGRCNGSGMTSASPSCASTGVGAGFARPCPDSSGIYWLSELI